MQTKNPAKSKINLYALIFAIVSLLGVWGVFPEDVVNKINQTLVYLSGPVLYVLRTYFTNTRLAWRNETSDIAIAPDLFDGDDNV